MSFDFEIITVNIRYKDNNIRLYYVCDTKKGKISSCSGRMSLLVSYDIYTVYTYKYYTRLHNVSRPGTIMILYTWSPTAVHIRGLIYDYLLLYCTVKGSERGVRVRTRENASIRCEGPSTRGACHIYNIIPTLYL